MYGSIHSKPTQEKVSSSPPKTIFEQIAEHADGLAVAGKVKQLGKALEEAEIK